MHKYTIDELIKSFKEHSETFRRLQKERREEFEKENPGQELPEWLKDNFVLSEALLSICEAIKKILAD